jgi:hypothetical protein
MSGLRTRPHDASVQAFLESVDSDRRPDCLDIVEMMRRATGEEPRMWGTAMVGFGEYHYKYESGREGDWPLSGFSPRKANLTIYVMAGVERFPTLLRKLGKHKIGKGCLYVKRLADVDTAVLEELVNASVKHLRKTYS